MREKLYFIVFHKWKYLIAIFRSKFFSKTNEIIDTLVYVAREKDKDWIFGAKVRRLSKFSSLNASTYFHNKLRDLPEADGYYFIYQNYFCRAIRSTPNILNKKNIVMFTHPNWKRKYSKTHVSWCLNKADYIICLNSKIKEDLIKIGIKKEKLIVMHIASNPNFFYSHERMTGSVGFCSNFGERKNPELVYQIIKNMPERNFHLIGRNWENFDEYNELVEMNNFTYHNNEDYSKYPDLYNKIDIFISPSILEGGPVPVLEAMLSNCVPIASKTGFCPDLIQHGKNGFLFDIDANHEKVIELIKQADTLTNNVRETVLEHSWENCAKKIDELFLKTI